MKRTHFILWVTLLACMMTLSGCCWFHGCRIETEPTLSDLLGGHVSGVKRVTKLPDVDVTQSFKDFQIGFQIGASKCFIKVDTTTTGVLNSDCTINEGEKPTITLSQAPENWEKVLQDVLLKDIYMFNFRVHINHPTLGTGYYYFEMLKL